MQDTKLDMIKIRVEKKYLLIPDESNYLIGKIKQLQAELAELKANTTGYQVACSWRDKYLAAIAMLKRLEKGKGAPCGYCPVCIEDLENGHKPNCELKRILKKGGNDV